MIRRRLLVAIAVLALSACAPPGRTGGAAPATSAPESPSPSVEPSATVGRGGLTADEINLAISSARSAAGSRSGGDWPPNVDRATAWVTTYDKASENLIGGIPVTPGDHRRLLVITLEGRFKLDNAPRPPQASAPAGTCMTFVVDVATGEERGLSLEERDEHCGAAGTVVLFSR